MQAMALKPSSTFSKLKIFCKSECEDQMEYERREEKPEGEGSD
jgi:hypothetical protein